MSYEERTWTGRELTVEDGEHVEVVLEEWLNLIGGVVRRRWFCALRSKTSGRGFRKTTLTDRDVEERFGNAVSIPEPPEDVGKTREELVLEQAIGKKKSLGVNTNGEGESS